ncbi:MAG: iron-siderophore ABC transporter substrate-binding protein [Rivularia sp. T60_A2020_040]|nr:iron-siderophore ABC transporter substrate-binding protein [Rivularia sp. T60_A2020_040]
MYKHRLRTQYTRYLQLGVVIACVFMLIIACDRAAYVPVNFQNQNIVCRNVKHVMGTTCIPEKFERVVTLDETSLESAIALGLKPIGSVISDFSVYFQDKLTGVQNIGTIGEPNLEKIIAIKPDLILGFEYQKDIYSLTSKIAPTLLFEFGHSGQWKDVFTKMSVALGKKAAAEQAMNKYYSRLEEFKQEMGDNISKIKVSVVRVYPTGINLYLRDSFCGTILQDAGLSRPESQNFTASEAQKLFNNPIQVSIGNELFEKADGDFIFIWTGENNSQETQAAQKKLEQLKSNPLWQNLKAVQQNKVYTVPNYWIGSGILAANAVIDDLFKYLVETP